jgi:hypothetical protein
LLSSGRPLALSWLFERADAVLATISAVEGAIVVSRLSTLGAALYSAGIPRDSVIALEAAVKADEFLVTAHGGAAETLRAKAVLLTANASRLDAFSRARPLPAKMDAAVAAS